MKVVEDWLVMKFIHEDGSSGGRVDEIRSCGNSGKGGWWEWRWCE